MSDPTEEQISQLRAWIKQEAASKSVDEIHAYVTERYERLSKTANAIPEDAMARPADDEWSPIDALKHLAEWNWQVGEDILHVCLTGERPANSQPTFPPDRTTLLGRNRESLESIYAHVSAADPEGFLSTTWEHPFFGQLNWREWFVFLGVHASDHAGQIRAMSGMNR